MPPPALPARVSRLREEDGPRADVRCAAGASRGRRMKQILFALALRTALVGCKKSSSGTAAPPTPDPAPVAEVAPVEPAPPPAPPAPKEAIATLAPTAKNKVTGTIAFKEVEGGLEVTATVEGLTAGD